MPKIKTSKYDPNTPAALVPRLGSGCLVAVCTSDTWDHITAHDSAPNGAPQLGAFCRVSRIVTPIEPDWERMNAFWHTEYEGGEDKNILILPDFPSLEKLELLNPEYNPEDMYSEPTILLEDREEVGWPGCFFDYSGR